MCSDSSSAALTAGQYLRPDTPNNSSVTGKSNYNVNMIPLLPLSLSKWIHRHSRFHRDGQQLYDIRPEKKKCLVALFIVSRWVKFWPTPTKKINTEINYHVIMYKMSFFLKMTYLFAGREGRLIYLQAGNFFIFSVNWKVDIFFMAFVNSDW